MPLPPCRCCGVGVVLAVALVAVAAPLASAASKKASFGARAKVLSDWSRTPPAAQSLEWLRDVDPGEATDFLRQLATTSNASEGQFMKLAEARIQGDSVRTFHELLVLNHWYSPLIEMLRSLERWHRRQFGAACPAGAAWALVWRDRAAAPTAACEASVLRKSLAESATGDRSSEVAVGAFVSSDKDHVLHSGSAEGPVVIIYGALVSETLKGLASLLNEVEKAAASWRIIFRHGDGPVGPDGAGHDVLTGWGLEMAIKSSEYKTHAEEKEGDGQNLLEGGEAEGGENAEAATDGDDGSASSEGDLQQEKNMELDGPLELDGLLFHVLLKRKKSLRSRLWAFKEGLEVERDTDAVLKAWEIKDIGLQATARIKSSSTPLLALMRVSQNFPAHVVGLSRTDVPESLRKQIQKLRGTVRENGEVFSLNGRLVRPDHSDLSLFPMLKSLLPYFVGIERLVRTGLKEAFACELLKDSSKTLPPTRLEWRSPLLPPASYHVTKDKKTQQWGTSLQHLMYGMGQGLAPLRIALFNLVFTFDPAEVTDLLAAAQVVSQTPMPMSLHLVMVPSQSGGGAGKWDEQVLGKAPAWVQKDGSDARGDSTRISRTIATAYASLLLKSPKKARKYIKALAEAAPKDDKRWPDTDATVEQLRSLWVENYQVEDGADAGEVWAEILRGSGFSAGMTENMTKYATELGVPVPSMLVNGKLLLKGAYEGNNIFQTIGMEQQMFMKGMYMGELQGEDQLEDYIASQGLLSAYHQDITPEVGQRGGEEGMGGKDTDDVHYLQWPAEPFLALTFLQSVEPEKAEAPEPEEGAAPDVLADLPDGSLNFFHVTVMDRLSHAYLLHTFASHMLAPDRALLASNKKIAVPPLLSHWSLLIDSSSAGADAGALDELAACVRGIVRLEAEDDGLNRQKLGTLKFLGAAVPAAGDGVSAAHMRELCELAVKKKIDPDHHKTAQVSIEKVRASFNAVHEKQLIAVAAARGGKADGTALWVCNGRRISLEADGQPVSPRHVQALELIEAQYDLSQTEGEVDPEGGGMGGMMGMMMGGMGGGQPEKGPPPPRTKPLFERLLNTTEDGGKAFKLQAHGLVASIRSEAFASSFGRNERFDQPQEIFEKAPAAFRISIPAPRPEAASPITVYGIVDPLSTTAQSASAVLALFGMAFNAEVHLVLNPHTRLSEYPLKRYYREVIRWPERLADGRKVSDLDDGGGDVGSGEAEFANLATKHTLTAAVHTLPTWLVTAHEAENDMDNLRLVDVGNGRWCETTYLLKKLYAEGQAFVLGEDGWPIASAKGLEIDVVDGGGQQVVDDTIVMGNLGYFQVSGNPGVYGVRLKAGLSNDTFEPASNKPVEVASYITPPLQFRVKTRPGRSPGDLAKAQEKDSSASRIGTAEKKETGTFSKLLGGITSMWGKGEESDSKALQAPGSAVSDDTLPTIHIFSVASGHLYEKLLGIMILSVRSTTKCPLHFWFISNFLSPKFRATIPLLAKRYNFAFDFVTYKWPSWLNPQSEKQRLIWAYKILFLDVLFPLDVPKVLYIDADQVVRADVRELWDTDLEGKVYGFVPMGDTNTATEGFRFWKQGYWKNHLAGLKYHISALFVVDLIELRRNAAADQLRGIYNQLSRDPNSLANLDQDLPNFAQQQVPIHSLPAEWLWCETWCSQESKAAAKTIDLCQNPLTKEPKIVMAKRIISEWQGYHDQMQRFQAEVDANVTREVAALPPPAAAAAEGKADRKADEL